MTNLSKEPIQLDRRRTLKMAAHTALISALALDTAWAQGHPAVMAEWARGLESINESAHWGAVAQEHWLTEVERLNASVPVADLAQYIDLDNAVRAFTYATAFPEFASVTLPDTAGRSAGARAWTTRLIGVRRGASALPHVHNHWVEAHLIMSGSFQIRTYDRVLDLPDAAVLRPVRDDLASVGGQVLMSDERENCHWFVAQEDRSISFFVSVTGVPAEAQSPNQLPHTFVDPTVAAQSDGTIVAPALSFADARAKFDP